VRDRKREEERASSEGGEEGQKTGGKEAQEMRGGEG
jgi:hypothetical protein